MRRKGANEGSTGLIGLATSLQFEALKLKMDIKVNIVIPQADTRMTQDFAKAVEENRVKQGKPPREARAPDPSVAERMAPDRVSAMVAWLCHRDCQAGATVHEAGAGYFAQVIPTPSHLLGRISPIFPPFSPVVCAFSPSRRGGSNQPQAQSAQRISSLMMTVCV